MALIKCSECGKDFSDKAPACPNCGCPTQNILNENVHKNKYGSSHKFLYGNNANAKEALENSKMANKGQLCPMCHGKNIQISIQAVSERSKGRNEVHKKSIVTRTGNKMGRAAMIGMTGGLWALTPKKSDYTETKKGKTKIVNHKFAICQNCGHSWELR